jgi:hypothetical protein
MVTMLLSSLLEKLRSKGVSSNWVEHDNQSIWIYDKISGLRIIQSANKRTLSLLPCDLGADTSRLIFRNLISSSIIFNMINELEDSGYDISVELNNAPFIFDQSPLLFPVSSFSVTIGPLNDNKTINRLVDLITDTMEDLSSILPISDAGRVEGSLLQTHVSRYERKKGNRTACIAVHGAVCQICKLDFGEKYPEIGDGFIHVHHLEPLSELSTPRAFNPETDLIPVCPNCHAMLHSRKPPLTPSELKSIMNPSIFP